MFTYYYFIVLLNILNSGDCVRLTVDGLCPAVFTPFNDEGELNLGIIPAYAVHLKKNNVDGLLIAGTSGEGPALSLGEKKELLEAWVDSANPLGLKVVMQVGGTVLPEVLELAKFSEEIGVDAIMTLPELYFKPKTEEAVVEYMKKVSDAAPSLPIIYYHHPSYSGVNLNIEKFFSLATSTIPNFKGVKCNFQSALEITAKNYLKEDQRLFMNSPLTMASNFLMGFNSSMAAGISIFPELILDIERAIKENNVTKAKELQMLLNKRIGVITSQGDYIPSHKAAMEMVTGIKVGDTRDPVTHLTSTQRKHLHEKLENLGVKCVSD